MRVRILIVACALAAHAAPVAAQPRVGPPQNRPAVSPYLNLLRPGNSAGVNYYGLVRPQLEFRNNLQNLQQQITDNRDAISAFAATAPLPTTGHTTSFLNTGGYFGGGQRAGGGAGANRGGGQPAQQRPQPARR